jgi:glutathione S-transferase
MAIVLYDLAGRDDRIRFSPYCWRTKFALSHKGLGFGTVPWRFTERDVIGFSGQAKVPVLRDGETVVADSWAIACYLEDRYPDAPSLFGGAGGRAGARFVNAWADATMVGGIASLIIRDLIDVIAPQDVAYFRASREERFERPLEEVQAGRDERVAGFRQSLLPVRLVLRGQPFLGGEAPGYADHIVAGTLMWPRIASRFEILAADDPLRPWQDRMLDLYGGVGRAAPLGGAGASSARRPGAAPR